MDGYEATRVVLSRIQSLDPKNASKIMGLLLIQDPGEKEMIRLAFGPETLIHSVILKAKKELNLSSPTSSSSSPPSPPLFSNNDPISISRQNSFPCSLRLGFNIPPSLTIPNISPELPNPDELISPSNGSSLNPASLPFYANNGGGGGDLMDELQLQDQLSFLNDNSLNHGPKSSDLYYPQMDSLSSPTGAASDSLLFPSYWGGGSVHRRSCSVSDVMGAEEYPNSGFGWRPCAYYTRGFCKNGSSCRFIHGGGFGESEGSNSLVSGTASPNSNKSQLMASSSPSFAYSPKCMNFLHQHQQQNDSQRAAALMMGEEMQKYGRSRLDRNELINAASRQIYLTFPADSTFREEDVSNYFSIYGPVQDVRIPYQQKRMFGFVTFVYPETVKIILAKGNPHFVCDARVLVKPYKEKGKIPDKKLQQQQQVDRGDFSPCGTPTGLESRDPFDLHLGTRMFYNTQDMLWRRKLEEQADLQQALELQNRRLMGLQLLDVKKHHHRGLSTGSPIPSPTHSPNIFSQSVAFPPLHSSMELAQGGNCSSPVPAILVTAPPEKQTAASGKESTGIEEIGNGKVSSHGENNYLQESFEHNLPDSPFASPTKVEYYSAFANGASEADKVSTLPVSSSANNLVTANLMANSPREMTSFKTLNCQLPRFSSGHGAISMYAGMGGPTCPVGI